MKKQYLLFLILLAVVSLFISCEKGGTIEVINNAGGPGTYNGETFLDKNIVTVVKIDQLDQAARDILVVGGSGKGTVMAKGQKKSFHCDEDAMYVVVAFYPVSTTPPFVFHEERLVGAGTTYQVEIKNK
jgi:hypothetical protein